MLNPNINKLRSRLSFISGKTYSITELSQLLQINRSQLAKMTTSSTNQSLAVVVSTKTVKKVILGFFKLFRPHLTKMTDKELGTLIVTDLFSEFPVSKIFPSVSEKNQIKKEATIEFRNFPNLK